VRSSGVVSVCLTIELSISAAAGRLSSCNEHC
jgi:hypothetical protein